MKLGKFIVIEGLDGSGKSIQAKRLADYLKSLGFRVNLSSEPTSGPVGAVIRQALTKRINLDQKTIAALFAADRLDHIYNPDNGIKKHLDEGIIEISDRYDLTSYAYQTRFADQDWVWQLNSQAIRPNLTIFLDVSPKECLKRLLASNIEQDIYHYEAHLAKARHKYMESIDTLRREKKEMIVIINAESNPDVVATEISNSAKEWLANIKEPEQ